MEKFIKYGSEYATYMDNWFWGRNAIIVASIILVIMMVWWKAKLEKRLFEGSRKYSDVQDVIVFTTFLEYMAVLVAVICIGMQIWAWATHITYQDYKGEFEIFKGSADTVNSDGTSYNRAIVLKDKDGNQQTVELDSDRGVFKKGENVEIIVKTKKDSDKPTLTKPIDSGDYQLKHIKRAD